MSSRVLAVLLLNLVAGSLTAQAVAVGSVSSSVQATAQAAPQRISVAFENTSLADALWTIARRSGTDVTFNGRMLPVKQVNYKAENITPEVAFAAVLAGTGLRINRAKNGKLVLVDSKTERTSNAQGVIAGKVTDAKTGRGISGATASIGINTGGATTGDDGSYRLTGIAAGTHTLSVRLVGYAKQTRSITVGDGASVTADFKLEPSANVLGQVVVTGTVIATELKAVPNAISVITAKQLEERGITQIQQLFRGDIPGLFAFNEGTNVSLDAVNMTSRGGTKLNLPASAISNPIKTYIDGVEVYDPRYMSQIDPRSIERIEILTGPQASTIYGSNALSGIMQIFTKRGYRARPQLTLTAMRGGTENNLNNAVAPNTSASAQLSGIDARWSYTAGTSWDYTGNWVPEIKTQRMGVYGSARGSIGPLTIDVPVRYSNTLNYKTGTQSSLANQQVYDGVRVPSALSISALRSRDMLKGRTMGLNLTYTPLPWWSYQVNLGTDTQTRETIQPAPRYGLPSDSGNSFSFAPSSRSSQSYRTTADISILDRAKVTLVAGGDHWQTHSFNGGGSNNGITLNGAFQQATFGRSPVEKNSGIFAQGTLGIQDAIFLTYGVRMEWNPYYGADARVLPGRYGIAYTRELGNVTAKVRGSYGRSTRPPSRGFKDEVMCAKDSFCTGNFLSRYGNFPYFLANPDLSPEFQQGGEGGLELYIGNRGSLVVTRYNQTVDDLIAQVQGIDSVRSLEAEPLGWCSRTQSDGYSYCLESQYLNIGSIRNQGWELQGSFNIGSVSTRGTYSWTKSRVLGITPRYQTLVGTAGAYQPGRAFPIPEHTWAWGVNYAHGGTTLAVNLTGIVGFYSTAPNDLTAISINSSRLPTTKASRWTFPGLYLGSRPGYVTADLNATHRLVTWLDAMLQVRNLTDHYQNDVNSNFPVAGRQSQIGFRARW